MALETRASKILRFGIFEVDLRAGELRKQGKRIKLQDQPFQVLTILLQRPGDVVTREELCSQIWPEGTFVDFDNSLNTAVNKLREALGDSAESPRFIETLPRRGYRFVSPVSADARRRTEATSTARRFAYPGAVAILVVAGALGGWFWNSRRGGVLSEKDTIVLGDFVNTTGDSIFDESLKRALAVSLQQSPFLTLLSDQQVQHTLQFMNRPANTALTRDVASEVCQRSRSKAFIAGTISTVGSQYLITLDAVNCASGALLAQVGSNAANRDKVLQALGQAATELRGRLGESLSSIQKYDRPIAEVTTSSLEALKIYSLGIKAFTEQGNAAALPYLKHAIQLDPDFASAYALAAAAYWNMEEVATASEYSKRAYSLRGHVTERERLQLEADQNAYITGDLIKDEQTAEMLKRVYPRVATGYVYAATDKMLRGDYEGAMVDSQKSLQILRDNNSVDNLWHCYAALNRLDDAKAVLDKGLADGIDPAELAGLYYLSAFLRKNAGAMQEQFVLATDSVGHESGMFFLQSGTEAFHGHLKQAREFSRRAAESGQRNGGAERVAGSYLFQAISEAEFGYSAKGREAASAALKLAPGGRYTRGIAAMALARADDASRAQKITESLATEFSQDTILNSYWLPMARASVSLQRRDYTRAIKDLHAAQDYALGSIYPWISSIMPLGPVYLRGYALLGTGQAKEAASEFRRIIDHPGIVLNSPVGALAQLGLGRALAAAGEKNEARAAYQDFFALWKDADPDIPILKQAKSEYVKLQ
jgi:eukaryotic-like serine/threonine-protein kinase